MSENFAQLLEEFFAQEARLGSVVKGTVVAIQKGYVIVDTGFKSESAIDASEFMNAQGELEVQVGDQVDVVLKAVEDGFGETVVSRGDAKRNEAWIALEKAFEEQATVTGFVNGKVKGGFTVELNGVRAFLPGSLVDTRPVRDSLNLEGQTLELKVIKLDQKRNNVVVSRRAVIETTNSADREEVLANLVEGSEVKGIVKNLTEYGAFVDLGGVDGLLHITDMAWKRVKHPSEVVTVGQEVTVKVLKFDKEKTRVSLGLKQCKANPWEHFASTHNKNDKVSGKIKSITDFGIFIGLEGGIDGLVHLSDISWNQSGEEAVRNYKKGDEVEAVVLQVDALKERISLGIKQLESDPFTNFVDSTKKGAIVSGKVTAVDAKGVSVELEGGVEAFIRANEATSERVEDITSVISVGDAIEAKFIGVDRKSRVINLSVRAKDEAEESAAIAQVNKQEVEVPNAMAAAFAQAKGE